MRVSGNSLRIDGGATGGTDFGPSREVDLSSATEATLTFDYRVQDDAGGGGTTRIEVSDNGGSTWTTLQTYDLTVFAPWTSQSFDISAYIASDTQVRFFGAPDNTNVYFEADDVQIEYDTGVAISGTVYTDEGTTNIGAGKTVRLLVNGCQRRHRHDRRPRHDAEPRQPRYLLRRSGCDRCQRRSRD